MPTAPEAPDFNTRISGLREAFGSQSPLGDLTPLPQVSAFAREEEKAKRQAETGEDEILGSIIRQDSPVDGAVARVVESQFPTDPSFDPYDPVRLEEDGKGLPPEYQRELIKARSAEHRAFLRMRLDDKLADMQRLGDLGFTGNARRILAGLVEPTNLALGLASGGASAALKTASTAKQVAAGLATGAGSGYAFERARQDVNFEDSNADAVWAGLMGIAFSVPFVGLTALEGRRLRTVAARELNGEDNVALRQEHARVFTEDVIAAENGPVRALPHYAGPEMVSFPDGTTMTGIEYKQRLADGHTFENGPAQPYTGDAKLPDLDSPLATTEPRVKDAPAAPVDVQNLPETAQPARLEVQNAPEPVQVEQPLAGKTTSGLDKHGNPVTGEIVRVREDGKLIVRLEDDKVITLDPANIDVGEPGHAAVVVDGFTPKSSFLPGSVGGAQVAPVPVEISPFRDWRFSVAAQMNKSENPVLQAVARVLVHDAVPNSKHYAQGRAVSEDKKLMTRVIGGELHRMVNDAYASAKQKMRGLDSGQFDSMAGVYLRDPTRFAGSPIAAELKQAAAASEKLSATMLAEMQRAGVKGSEHLAANPKYLTRSWLPEEITAKAKLHDDATINKLFAQAMIDKAETIARFRSRHPSSKVTDAQILEQSAAKFVKAVQRLEYSHLSNELLLTATDMPTLRAELSKADLPASEIDSMIDHLFEVQKSGARDAGNPPQLKYRFNLDESASIVTPNGERLYLSDLMENNVRVIADRYMNSMGGHVAMARQGIRSRADFEARLQEAVADHEGAGAGRSGERFGKEMEMARDVYNNIVGRPMSNQKFNTGDRVFNVVRSYGRSVYLGQLGFTAMNEAFHSANLMTWRAAITQMPSLGQFVQAARGGQVPSKGLAGDVIQMLGNLNESISGYMRQHEIADHTYGKGLIRGENAGNWLSHKVDRISGNAFMTTITRGMAAAGTIQKFANFANGKLKLDDTWRARLVGAGINADDIDGVLAQLRNHVEMDGDRVVGVKWEEWSAKDPATYHDFQTAVDREVRQGVQDHDLGSTLMWQHSSVGKIFGELRAFSIASHDKQLANALHYRDRVALQMFTVSVVTNGLAYVVQTSMNFAHDTKELNKRLTAQRIAKAAYARSSMMGMLPFFTDTLIPGFLSPMAMVSGQGLTANTDSRNILMPPSFNLLSKAVSFGQKGELKDGLTLLPFSNTYGVRNLIDMVSKSHY